jgi:hypothetical protein
MKKRNREISKKELLGDRNIIRVLTSLTHRDIFYRRDSQVEVDKETARHLIAEGQAELVSLIFNKSLRMVGRPVKFK